MGNISEHACEKKKNNNNKKPQLTLNSPKGPHSSRVVGTFEKYGDPDLVFF